MIKAVSEIIKSTSDSKIFIENVIIPTMESIYKEIKNQLFILKNNQKYALSLISNVYMLHT